MLAHQRSARPELGAFAAWLNGRMRERRMSGNELARRIASSGSGVAEYRKAQRRPRFETLRRIAAVFGTTAEDLEAMLPAEETDAARPERVSPLDIERARVLLHREGYTGLRYTPVTTDDLIDRSPPVVRGMVLWYDPRLPLTPECVVAVQVHGNLMVRTLDADGRTLRSAVAPPFPLADVDEVLGVGTLAQLTL